MSTGEKASIIYSAEFCEILRISKKRNPSASAELKEYPEKMKKQNAAIWCALLLIALPIAVLLLVPSPSARIVDVVQPLMESEEIDYWNPDIFFLTKYGLTAAVSVLCGLVLTLLCSRKRLPLDTCAAICTVGGFGALVGARVLYMLARYSYIMVDLGGSSFFWQFWQGGYTLYGGILGGMGAIALYAKLTKQKALPLLDAVTPGALLALCALPRVSRGRASANRWTISAGTSCLSRMRTGRCWFGHMKPSLRQSRS